MIKKLKFILPIFAVSFFSVNANAEQVKKLDFTGSSKTEKVIITINDDVQKMEYYTPSRDHKYTILDYDVQSDGSSKIVTATVLDPMYNTASEVMLYANSSFSDMRIGRKRITFTYVEDFRIEAK